MHVPICKSASDQIGDCTQVPTEGEVRETRQREGVPRRFSGCEVGAPPEAHSPSFSEAPLLGIPMLSYKSDCVVYYKRFPPRATPNGSMTPKEGGLVISPRPKLVPSYTSIWQCGKCVCRLISNLKSGGWPPGRLLPYADRYTGAGTGSRCRSVTGSHSYRGDYL